MTVWYFSLSAEGWDTTSGFSFAAGEGIGNDGCLKEVDVSNPSTSISLDSVPVNPGDPISFWCKIENHSSPGEVIAVSLRIDGIVNLGTISRDFTADSGGWVKISGTISEAGNATLAMIEINPAIEATCTCWIDNVYFNQLDTARFYFGLKKLEEKFDLPFTSVAPGAMALDRSLGTVVIGGFAGVGNEPVVFSTYPYGTGTVSSEQFPTGTAVTSLKWI